jgi:hypothetical protein
MQLSKWYISTSKLTAVQLVKKCGKPRARWLESVETDLRKMGVKNWRRKAQDREQWRTILKEAKVHRGL